MLDLNIPIFNGIEVLQTIKEDRSLKKIPVIILTTSPNHKDVKKAFENHADNYITKPIDLDKFFEVIVEIEEFWNKLSNLSE